MASELFDKIDWEAAECALSKRQIEESLRHIKGWHLLENEIEKNFEFENFGQAMDFINDVAKAAIAQNHHPSIQLWNITHVKITIKTLCINGLSKLDFILAAIIDTLPASKQSHLHIPMP